MIDVFFFILESELHFQRCDAANDGSFCVSMRTKFSLNQTESPIESMAGSVNTIYLYEN